MVPERDFRRPPYERAVASWGSSDPARLAQELVRFRTRDVHHYRRIKVLERRLEAATKEAAKAKKELSVLRGDHSAQSSKSDNRLVRNKSRNDSSGTGFLKSFKEAQRLFDIEGSVQEPHRILRAALESAEEHEIAGYQRDFVQKLEAWNDLMTLEPKLPAAGSNPVYLPTDRIMYCAHSTGEYNSNGYSVRTSGLVSALKEHGEDVMVLARPGYPWDAPKTDREVPAARRFSSKHLGVEHVYVPGPNLRTQPLTQYMQETTDAIVREALISRPRIIQATSNYFMALPALLAARRLGVPFIYEVRGLWEVTQASAKGDRWFFSERFLLARRIEGLIAREADHVFAITDEVKEELISRGAEGARISILPNATDPAVYAPVRKNLSLLSKHGIPENAFIIGYAGSMVHYEGLDVLLRAFADLRRTAPEAFLMLVGDGPELENLRTLAGDLGVERFVVFTGRVEQAQVPEYVNLFHVAPCTRISMPVTELVSPLKPLESMASGAALVASDISPLRTFVGSDGSRGVLFNAGDASSLKDRLLLLRNSSHLREGLARAARYWVASERSWKTVAARAFGVYQELRGPSSGGPADGGIPVRPLEEIRLGVIADTFTMHALQSAHLIPISRQGWRDQLKSDRLDALFVESAWEGNGGEWQRGVGYYSDEEAQDLRELVAECQALGIPTLFWNKEDPVHFSRFVKTASLFDHVFTTDSDCVRNYWSARGPQVRSVSSVPFFAQRASHHPFRGERPYSHTVAYAGTYYGSRYADRTRTLDLILGEAHEHGLTIYDRQSTLPNSPYSFSDRLRPFVTGGLDYAEMLEAYKSHPVHVNVNSVVTSPTMFSRRVVEAAASGTPVLSGPSEAIRQLFPDVVPIVDQAGQAEMLSFYWLNDEEGRIVDAWAVHRAVYRAHMADQRLAYMLRVAGIDVEVRGIPSYALNIDEVNDDLIPLILGQTWKPQIVVSSSIMEAQKKRLAQAGVKWAAEPPSGLPVVEVGQHLVDETLAEDLMRSYEIAKTTGLEVGQLVVDSKDLSKPGTALLRVDDEAGVAVDAPRAQIDARGTTVVLRRHVPQIVESPGGNQRLDKGTKTVLIAGHDLKFAKQLIDDLRSTGHTLLFDEWQGHGGHDPRKSQELLEQADVVFCEWALGNLAWYSRHVKPHQRLICRFHSQELFSPYPRRAKIDRVDTAIFVGEQVREMAIRRFGFPAHKSLVIPNSVASELFDVSRDATNRFVLGFVGIVPQSKRLDLALDLIRCLRKRDERFELRVKGRMPYEYPWVVSRESEVLFYSHELAATGSDPLLRGAVHFDGFGNDMTSWYATVGHVISVSDFESFHLTLADGAASGAVPHTLSWPGAEKIYPHDRISHSVEAMADQIIAESEEALFLRRSHEARSNAENFRDSAVLRRMRNVIFGPEPH